MNSKQLNAAQNMKDALRCCVSVSAVALEDMAAAELKAIDGTEGSPRQIASVVQNVKSYLKARGVKVQG